MKRDFLILLVLFFALSAPAWCTCPADTVDLNNCDSVYLEPASQDLPTGPTYPDSIRVSIFITTDDVIGDPVVDSIAGVIVPLCVTHTNPAKFCSLSDYRNKTALPGPATFARSIFRPINGETTWMNDLWLAGDGAVEDWDTKILSLGNGAGDSTHFWLSLLASAPDDARLGLLSHKLTATMTFWIQDSMTICMDSCFWPPSNQFGFFRADAKFFVPRMGTAHDPASYEVCFRSSDVKEVSGTDEARPSQFSLSQNHPNPFNPTTNFQFTVSRTAHVKIEVFNIVGRRVRTLVDKEMSPGVYMADWNGTDGSGSPVSSGIYFYRMQAGDFSGMKKMLLLK
ncbi:MAG: FlgD immunoglobulin-like domain containing protein [Candidatus Zixiibacteriota bacterium]